VPKNRKPLITVASFQQICLQLDSKAQIVVHWMQQAVSTSMASMHVWQFHQERM